MKYAYLYAILIILVVAIGCGKGPDTVTSTPTADSGTGAQQTQQTAQTTQTAAVSYELSSEEEAKATQFEQAKKTMISTPYKIMQVGDVYVFGLGIKNVMPKEGNFRVALHFKEAKTTGGVATLIEGTEDDAMITWLGKNRFGIEKIGSGQEKVLPLIVEVKPTIGPGENTIPGSYVFDVMVEYESTPQFWDTYQENTLTIKVKE
ncbi:MAG: hypothetical protein KKE20_01855 [Nanoarchaeota archaeon]|nr:hypothetical protein [Nanoarchaeota archaeon]